MSQWDKFLSSFNSSSKKYVHVDDAKPNPAALLMEGSLYTPENLTPQAVAQLEPKMLCPNCSQVCVGIAGAEPQYQIPQTNAPCLSLGDNFAEPTRMCYSVEPCSCKVSQEWAAAFTKELTRRLCGDKPQPIVDMTQEERQAKVLQLETRISKLYSAQSVAISKEHKDAIQYRLVVLTDQLMRLLPGYHNKAIPVDLSPKVKQWATDKGYHMPPTEMTSSAKDFLDSFNDIVTGIFSNAGVPESAHSGQSSTLTGAKEALAKMKSMLKEKSPSAFMQQLERDYSAPSNQMFNAEMLNSGKGVTFDPATGEIRDANGKSLGVVAQKPGDDFDYYKSYPMPKVFGQAKNPEQQQSLGNILATSSIEELTNIIGGGGFRLPKAWLSNLLGMFSPAKQPIIDILRKLVNTDNHAEIAVRATFIERNLRNHKNADETLAPLTVQFLAHVCKYIISPNPLAIGSPAGKPVAACVPPPTEAQTREQFHAQFQRKRRRIRRIED